MSHEKSDICLHIFGMRACSLSSFHMIDLSSFHISLGVSILWKRLNGRIAMLIIYKY